MDAGLLQDRLEGHAVPLPLGLEPRHVLDPGRLRQGIQVGPSQPQRPLDRAVDRQDEFLAHGSGLTGGFVRGAPDGWWPRGRPAAPRARPGCAGSSGRRSLDRRYNTAPAGARLRSAASTPRRGSTRPEAGAPPPGGIKTRRLRDGAASEAVRGIPRGQQPNPTFGSRPLSQAPTPFPGPLRHDVIDGDRCERLVGDHHGNLLARLEVLTTRVTTRTGTCIDLDLAIDQVDHPVDRDAL